ncbi:MAG: T9SS type A sorting domain-containing protein [Bacteroidota bacterium]
MSVSSGDFSDISTWADFFGNPPTVLNANDDFSIQPGHVVDVDQNTTARAIIVTGGTLNISTGITLTVSGAPGIGVNVDLAGVVNLDAGGTLNIDNSGDAGLQVGATGQFNMDGTLNISNLGDGDFFDDGITLFNDFTINGTINIENFDDGEGIYMDNDAILTIAGTGSLNIDGTINGSNGINVDDDDCVVQVLAGGMLMIRGMGSDGIDAFVGTVTNAGTIIIDDVSSDGIFNGDSFTNTGVITITNPGQEGIDNVDGATFNNSGSITINTSVQSGIRLISNSTLNNFSTGSIDINSPGRSGVQGAFNSTFNNQGVLDVDDPTFQYSENPVLLNSGTLSGEGIFTSTSLSLQSGAIIAPGSATQQMSFSGNTSFANATVAIDVTSASVFDFLSISGVATLGGTLSATINYTPTANDRIVFLTATTISGVFSSINPALPANWAVDYSVAGEVALVYSGILPVEWLGFSAHSQENEVELRWQTATEIDNIGFEIWHATDAKAWEHIDFVEGKGDSFQAQAYLFTHRQPVIGNNYYRLRQLDYDGKFSDSVVRQVSVENHLAEEQLKLYPNPTVDYTMVSLPQRHQAGTVQVVSPNGQIMLTTPIAADQSQIELNAQSWPRGMYFITVQLGSEAYTQRLIRRE